jgi:hypothetical protein
METALLGSWANNRGAYMAVELAEPMFAVTWIPSRRQTGVEPRQVVGENSVSIAGKAGCNVAFPTFWTKLSHFGN